MSRLITPTLRNAIDIPDSYYMLVKADIYPSRIYFESIIDNYPLLPDINPLKEDIIYSSVSGKLVTFFYDNGSLKYMIQGSSEVTTIGGDIYTPADAKPGAFESTFFYYDTDGYIDRYAIDWNAIEGRNATPFTTYEQGSYIEDGFPIYAVHAVSGTQAMAIGYDDGGFRPVYTIDGYYLPCPFRFMFPSMMPYVDADGNELEVRPTEELILCSGALLLDNKIFVYMSNSSNGSVEGVYFDTETLTWSDIFIALLTDMDTSECEFRVSNAYAHNGTAYMCGQFIRLDSLDGAEPYTLLLHSEDGITFSVERNTLVSNIGYRFLACVGGGNLYLGSANRVCYSPLTWVFDGKTGAGILASVDETQIKSFDDGDLSSVHLTLVSGLEQYYDHQDVIENARMIVYLGMKTTAGDEYVKYGTYILESITFSLAMGKRDTVITATSESLSKLSGLTMPFCSELQGKSVSYSAMTKDSLELYAVGGCRTETKFSVDMWKHELYDNSDEAIVGIDMHLSGGVNYYETTGEHKLGIITDDEIANIIILDSNPKIVGDSVVVNIHGWSHSVAGSENDTISIVLITVDDDDVESTNIVEAGQRWSNTYPTPVTRNDPIVLDIDADGLGIVGQRIKKVGVVFECATATWFNIARLDFMSGVEAYYSYEDADTGWEKLDEGAFKLPGIGRPYIMFSRTPLNTFEFSLAAEFSNTIAQGDMIASHPVATGFVGLAENGSNYIAGRYNKQNGKVELVKCRDGIEEVLLSTTVGFAVTDAHKIRFDHRGGHFDIYMWDNATSRFKRVLYDTGASAYGYDWKEEDGYIYTSRTASMWCGIYGILGTPSARILGYYAGESDNANNADGIPVAPLSDVSEFPDATLGNPGYLRIGEDVFSYGGNDSPANTSGKIAHPIPCRGPYQYRQMGKYEAPFGNGNYGLECRDFDWTASETLTVGKLIAISSGANFVSTGDDWTIYITTGGETVWLRNRARHYSDNEQIGKLYHTLAHKIWVVGGFEDIVLTSTKSTRVGHSEGEIAYYNIPGEIKCLWYMGVGGSDDTTVEDLIAKVCGIAGASYTFPGDFTLSSLAVSGQQTVLTMPYAEGLDLVFELESDDNGVTLYTNIKIKPDSYEQKSTILDDTDISVVIANLGGGVWTYAIRSRPSNALIYATEFAAEGATQKFRVLYQNNAISLYQNGQWVTTVTFDELVYGNSLVLVASGTVTLNNIRIDELSDWREAIFIDLQTDGRSAINSIIQQRPIEMQPLSDGSLRFYYEIVRDSVVGIREPRVHSYTHSIPRDGASDAIVYGSKDAKTLQDADYARTLGFSTRLYQMSDLNVGAIRAAQVIQKKAFEASHSHQLTLRPDLDIVIGDVYLLEYISSISGRLIDKDIIIEGVSVNIKMTGARTTSSMSVQGREVYVEPT